MLTKPFMKIAVLAAAALLMSGTLAQAQPGADTGAAGAGASGGASMGAGSGMDSGSTGAGASSGASGGAGTDGAGAGTSSGAGMGSGMGMGSGTGMESGSGMMTSQMDPYAARMHARRSRATVMPSIVNDSVYPDPNNPGMDDPAAKARRDAKRAARSGGRSTPAGAGSDSSSSPAR